MARFACRIGVCLAALLAVAVPGAWAQQWRQPPRIGYVWPAGGRHGETFEVTIGGQYLKDTADVVVSGEGVQAELVDYIRPANSKELAVIREIWTQARKKAQAEAKGGRARRQLAVRRLFLQMAKEKGITDKQIDAFNRFRQQRNDPKRQLNPQLSESLTVRLTVSADARPGLRELRVTTKLGLSNPLRFRVGELPEIRESEPNDKASGATAVPSLPVVLNGQIMPGDVDRFRLTARKGQRLVVRVSARDLIPVSYTHLRAHET